MKPRVLVSALAALLLALPASGKDEARFKSIEAKHFTRAEGVEVSPEFSDLLYAELKTALKKTGRFDDIVGEGEVVDAADAPRSLVLEGALLEYKKGSVAKQVLIGFGAGMRSLRAQITVHRRDEKQPLLDKTLKVRASSTWDEKTLANFLAKKIAGELKSGLPH